MIIKKTLSVSVVILSLIFAATSSIYSLDSVDKDDIESLYKNSVFKGNESYRWKLKVSCGKPKCKTISVSKKEAKREAKYEEVLRDVFVDACNLIRMPSSIGKRMTRNFKSPFVKAGKYKIIRKRVWLLRVNVLTKKSYIERKGVSVKVIYLNSRKTVLSRVLWKK